MSVQETDVVELASVHEGGGSVILTASDHLSWSDSFGHQTILQQTLNPSPGFY